MVCAICTRWSRASRPQDIESTHRQVVEREGGILWPHSHQGEHRGHDLMRYARVDGSRGDLGRPLLGAGVRVQLRIVMWEMVTKETAMCGTHLRGRYTGRA